MEHVLHALTPANRRVCRVCLHTGLRVSDVLALRSADLKQHMWVTEQKTGKRRMIGLPADLYNDLRKHMGGTYVFPGRTKLKPRTRQAVWKDLKRAAKAFRIKENLGTHSCRKMYAQNLMRKYGDIEKVKKALNHDRYTTTMLYLMADRIRPDRESGG